MAGRLDWLSDRLKRWAKVFEVMNGEAIRFSNKKIAVILNSLGNNIMGEVRNRIIKWTFHMEPPLDNLGGQVAGMGDRGGELFSKCCCYFFVAGGGFEGKDDGLIERGFGTFAIQGFYYDPQA